jgi:hypothetical protein
MNKPTSKEAQKRLDDWKYGSRPAYHSQPILIAHLGNISGRDEDRENSLAYLKAALTQGYHVCCQVIFRYEAFLLPSARGLEQISGSLLANPRVWCRAESAETLDALCSIGAHSFAPAAPYSLTSAGFIWTLPESPLAPRAIAVLPELASPTWFESSEAAGVCSDEVARYL